MNRRKFRSGCIYCRYYVWGGGQKTEYCVSPSKRTGLVTHRVLIGFTDRVCPQQTDKRGK